MSEVQEWAEEAGLDIHTRLWAFGEGDDKCYCAECEIARERYGAWLQEQSALASARPPHTHYCQHCAGRWECGDSTCEAGEVRGCADALAPATQEKEGE